MTLKGVLRHALCTLKSIRVYDLIHRVFGHPYYGSNGEEPTLIKFTLQHTDYKSVGAYRKFSGLSQVEDYGTQSTPGADVEPVRSLNHVP